MNKQEAISDSANTRYEQASRLVKVYPMEDWNSDILARIKNLVGENVSQEVATKVRAQMSEKSILEKRLKLLTDVFTASELKILADVGEQKDGKGLLRKLSIYDDKLRENIAPIVTSVLAGETTISK